MYIHGKGGKMMQMEDLCEEKKKLLERIFSIPISIF